MPDRSPYHYALIRIVPNLDRGECFNAGIVLLCRPKRFLRARTHLDGRRLALYAPELEPGEVVPYLEAIERIAAGDPGAGPIAQLSITERFHWLTAPASTMIQPSPVHTGLSDDPTRLLDHLFLELVI